MTTSGNRCGALVLGLGEALWDVLPGGRRCGGAPANVVCHLTQLGIGSALVSAVGKDVAGDELADFLRSRGIDTRFISRNDLPTGEVRVVLHAGVPVYDICRPAAWDAIASSPLLDMAAKSAAGMIWGTLAQRDLRSRNAILRLVAAAPPECLKCFDINLRGNYYDAAVIEQSLRLANVLKINEEELKIAGDLLRLGGSREELVRQLCRKYALRYVICTLGADGSMLHDGVAFRHYPVLPCKVVDTVGCGDAFLAAWCAVVLRGGTPQQGMIAGTKRAAETAAHPGAMA